MKHPLFIKIRDTILLFKMFMLILTKMTHRVSLCFVPFPAQRTFQSLSSHTPELLSIWGEEGLTPEVIPFLPRSLRGLFFFRVRFT